MISFPAMVVATWPCSCGRRVPASVGVCRCGQPRPALHAGEVSGAEAAPPREGDESWAWLAKVLPVVGMVALYFGSRLLYRHLDSTAARDAVVTALAERIPRETARRVVDRYHAVCFEQHYRIGWGRRASAHFEGEAYARCVADRVIADFDRDPPELPAVTMPRRPRPAPSPVTTMPASPRPTFGPVTLGDVKIVSFEREPQAKVQAGFVAIGKGMTTSAFCAFLIQCEGRSRGLPIVVPCLLQVDGIKATGELHHAGNQAAPAGTVCRLELALSDGSQTRSNTVVTTLP